MATPATLDSQAAPVRHGALWSVLRRIFSFHLLSISFLVLFTIRLSGSLHTPSALFADPDIWWHLADARNLFATHHFIFSEPYSFTVAGQPWINPEWGSEIPYWLGYQALHLHGIYLVACLLAIGNLVLLYMRSLRKTVNPWPALFAAVIGLCLLAVNTGARTILCGYLCLSAVLWVMDTVEQGSTRWLAALPVIFCLWINLHGSWVIGMALLFLYIACGFVGVRQGLVEQERRPWKLQQLLLIAFGASCAALFVNPYGWGLVWNPFDMMWKQPLNIAVIEEWKPLNLHEMIGKIAVLAIAIVLTAALLKQKTWKLYELAFLAFAWYAAFSHTRFTVMAAVITAPWIAESLGVLMWSKPLEREYPAVNVLFAAGALAWALLSVPTESALAKGLAEHYPQQAIHALQPGWRVLSQYDFGGMLAFQGKPEFVDSRVDTFEHHGVFGDYLDAIQITRPLEVLDKYKIDHVLFVEKAPLVYLLERTPGWKVTMKDGKYVLMERR